MNGTTAGIGRGPALALVLIVLAPMGLGAQESRSSLITRAYEEFDANRRIALLGAAIDPARGPADSLWTVGVQLLAQTLIEEDREPLADVVVRWAVRMEPDLRADTLRFLPQVADAVRRARARATTADEPGPADAVTTWGWPATFSVTRAGRIRVAPASTPEPLRVLVEGLGGIQPGSSRAASAGTYRIHASAPGYESLTLSREVLPGVTTSIEFDLRPLLADAVAQRLGRHLVRLSAEGPEGTRCASGILLDDDGLLLTSYEAVRGAPSVEVAAGGGRLSFEDPQVAAYDIERGVAVLKVEFSGAEPLGLNTVVREDDHTWAFHYSDCNVARTTSTRANSAQGRRDRLRLAVVLPPAATGAPLVDVNGQLIGLVQEDDLATPAAVIEPVLVRARRSLAAGRLLSLDEVALREEGVATAQVERGGFPWGWAALGAAGVGAVVGIVMASGGGGEDGDGTGTGGIIISLPNQ